MIPRRLLSRRRNWPLYAKALDLHLEGYSLNQIGYCLGVTKQRASQMVTLAKIQLAYRVFYVERPVFQKSWIGRVNGRINL